MQKKHRKIMEKFGIIAASSDTTAEARENEVIPSEENGNLKDLATDSQRRMNGKKEIVLVSRIRISEDITVSYQIETKPGYQPKPYLSIDRKVGRRPDGRPKWIHVHIFDLDTLDSLRTGLGKIEDMVYLPSKYLHLKSDPETLMRLEESGIMEEVKNYVSQIS